MPGDTRKRLIESGLNRFYREGFRNVALDQILNDVGISKTAFYKHFESKEDLMLAVLEDRTQWLQNRLLELVRERCGHSARQQLELLMDVVEEIAHSAEFRGCIFINASMEFPLPHDPAHQAALRNRTAIRQIVHDIAERAGAKEPMPLADELCLVMEGAYTSRQVTADPGALKTARTIFQRIIDAHLGVEKKDRRAGATA